MEQRDALMLLARMLLMTLFLITGWQKLTNFSGTVSYMKTTATPLPVVSTVVAIVVEFFFGIGIIVGIWTRILAWIFVAFTMATALLGHRYWRLQGEERHANLLNFYKNVSIAGGLLLLAIVGPGRFALTGP